MAPHYSELPDDLIIDILTRLPAKSIGRCRCLSKQWQSVASDPKLIQTHASLAPISGFFFFYHNRRIQQHYLPIDDTCKPSAILNDPSLSVVASCNGLALFRCSDESSTNKSLFLRNPLTRKQLVIAPPASTSLSDPFFLAFDPSSSPAFKVVGFGKVRGVLKMHVYSSEARSWKALERADARSIKDNKGRGVFWNGCLVWLSRNAGRFRPWDVEGEPLKRLPQPRKKCVYFGESGGRLYFIPKPRRGATFVVLAMESESSGWSVLYHVNLHPLRDVYPEVRKCYRDFCERSTVFFVQGESREEDQLLLCVRGLLISFHLQNKTFATVCRGLHAGRVRIFPHKFTLYSVLE